MENRYDKYKDSGIAWIGEIPEHWEVKKGKNLFRKEERPVRDNDEIITCFRDGEVTLRSSRRTDGFTNAMKEVGYQGVRKGDLVIHNMDAFAGAIGVSDSDGKSTPVYSVCTPKNKVEADVYYYAYLLRSYALEGVIQSLAKGIRERSTDFRYKEFGDLFYQQPPLPEQQSIATYLDQKCGEIDELITLQEEMITKLQSYKQSVITEAVTKGLDKNVPLKDSGIEWIGEIPQHWETYQLKRCSNFINGYAFNSSHFNKDKGIPVIRIGDILNEQISFENIVYIQENNELEKFVACKNDILIAMSGATVGKIGIYSAEDKVYINQRVGIIRTIQYNFIKRMFATNGFVDYVNLSSAGSAQPNISSEGILNFYIPVPSIKEQQTISDYLDKKCSEIDELISIKQQKIEKLKDYKKSLIFECVTGKRKVS